MLRGRGRLHCIVKMVEDSWDISGEGKRRRVINGKQPLWAHLEPVNKNRLFVLIIGAMFQAGAFIPLLLSTPSFTAFGNRDALQPGNSGA